MFSTLLYLPNSSDNICYCACSMHCIVFQKFLSLGCPTPPSPSVMFGIGEDIWYSKCSIESKSQIAKFTTFTELRSAATLEVFFRYFPNPGNCRIIRGVWRLGHCLSYHCHQPASCSGFSRNGIGKTQTRQTCHDANPLLRCRT